MNQLIREDDAKLNKSYAYAYDNQGNILTKTEYAYTLGTLGTAVDTKTYSYGNTEWCDLLTSYDGQDIVYDEAGNIRWYKGWLYTWENGRQLKSISKFNNWSGEGIPTEEDTPDSYVEYKYNSDGIRIGKIVDGVESTYLLDGTNVQKETFGTTTLQYTYGLDGKLVSVNYNGTEYYYAYNAQGDVVALYNQSAEVVCRYYYDAWGNAISIVDASGNAITISTHIANVNPYRYRCYRYDTETNLYYLQSRYYDCEMGRFINADDTNLLQLAQGKLLGANLYAYCNNNPVMNSDPTGYFVIASWIVGGLLDVAFVLLNAAMEAGFIGFSLTIRALSKSWWTVGAAEYLLKNVIKVFGYGMLNPILTVIRTVIWLLTGATIYFLTGAAISNALSYMGNHLGLILGYLLSWGSFISGVIDFIDGRFDGKISF